MNMLLLSTWVDLFLSPRGSIIGVITPKSVFICYKTKVDSGECSQRGALRAGNQCIKWSKWT